MKVTLLITCSPESQLAAKALDFARALLRQRHDIERLFFFADGTRQALASSPIAAEWRALMEQDNVAISVCSGSAAERGVTSNNALLPIAGMGDWLMATLACDKLVTF